MAAAFSYIFLSFHHSCTFITHVPISGISWKVILNDKIYIWSMLRLFEEILLLGSPPPTFPFATYSWDFKLNTLTTVYSSSDQPTSSAKAQGSIYNFGPLSLIYIYIYILDDEALICILKHRIPNLVDHFNFISWGWFQIISHTFRSLELSHALKNVLIQASHKLYMTLMENAKTK